VAPAKCAQGILTLIDWIVLMAKRTPLCGQKSLENRITIRQELCPTMPIVWQGSMRVLQVICHASELSNQIGQTNN